MSTVSGSDAVYKLADVHCIDTYWTEQPGVALAPSVLPTAGHDTFLVSKVPSTEDTNLVLLMAGQAVEAITQENAAASRMAFMQSKAVNPENQGYHLRWIPTGKPSEGHYNDMGFMFGDFAMTVHLYGHVDLYQKDPTSETGWKYVYKFRFSPYKLPTAAEWDIIYHEGTVATPDGLTGILEVSIIPLPPNHLVFVWSPGNTNRRESLVYDLPEPRLAPLGDYYEVTKAGPWMLYGSSRKRTIRVQVSNLIFPKQAVAKDSQKLYYAPTEAGVITVNWQKPRSGAFSVVVGLKATDGTTDFVPDGIKTELLNTITLNGDGTHTPVWESYNYAFPQTRRVTTPPEVPVERIHKFRISDLEERNRRSVVFELWDEDRSMSRLYFRREIPWKLEVDGHFVMSGRTKQDGIQALDTPDHIPHITIMASDEWEKLYNMRWFGKEEDYACFDKVRRDDAIKSLLQTAGYTPEQMDIADDPMILTEGSKPDKPLWRPKPNQTVGEFLDRIVGWFSPYVLEWGTGGEAKWYYHKLPDESSASVATFKASHSYAVGQAERLIYNNFTWTPHGPECTMFWAFGVDAHSRKAICAKYTNVPAIDDDTSEDYLGRVQQMGLGFDEACSEGMCQYIARVAGKRICHATKKATWVSESKYSWQPWLVKVGSIVTVEERGIFRITSICPEIENEVIINTQYTGVWLRDEPEE